MPKKDGMYVLEEMKKHNINKKVIVATSYNTGEVIREVSEYGVNYYILKPFDFTDLEKRILDLLNKKKNSKNIDLHHNNIQISITKILHMSNCYPPTRVLYHSCLRTEMKTFICIILPLMNLVG